MQGWVYGGSGGEVRGSLTVLARPDAASCDAFFGWRTCKQQALSGAKWGQRGDLRYGGGRKPGINAGKSGGSRLFPKGLEGEPESAL